MCCFIFREWDHHVFHHSLHRTVDSTHWTLPHTREQCHKPTVEDMIWHNLSVLSRRHMLLELSEDRHHTGRQYTSRTGNIHPSLVLSQAAFNVLISNGRFCKRNLLYLRFTYFISDRKLSHSSKKKELSTFQK